MRPGATFTARNALSYDQCDLGAKTITEDFGDTHLTWTSSNVYNTATITRANDSGKTMADWLRADGTVAAPPYAYSAGSAPTSPPAAGAGVSGADVVP
jgi:pectate lyase